MTHAPFTDRFITFTEAREDDDTTRDSPALVLNPRSISSFRLGDETDDGQVSLLITQLNGDHFTFGPMPRLKARMVFRELLSELGPKNPVSIPEGTSLSIKEA